jgi:hypothetical protein
VCCCGDKADGGVLEAHFDEVAGPLEEQAGVETGVEWAQLGQVAHLVGGDPLGPQARGGPEGLGDGCARRNCQERRDDGAELEKIMLDFCSKAIGLRYERLTAKRRVWLSVI